MEYKIVTTDMRLAAASLGCCFMSLMGVLVPLTLSALIKREYEFIELPPPAGGFCGQEGAKPPPECMEESAFREAAALTSFQTALFYAAILALSGLFTFGHWVRGAYRFK